MAEATEEPTPRRLADARAEGLVARSSDLTAAAALAAGLGAALLALGSMGARAVELMRSQLSMAGNADPQNLGASLDLVVTQAVALTLPIAGAAMVAALVVGGIQTRGLFSPKVLTLAPRRLQPFAGSSRMFSSHGAVRLAKRVLVLALSTWVVWATVAPRLRDLLLLPGQPPALTSRFLVEVTSLLALRVTVLFTVIGVVDYLWQRRATNQQLKMSRDEVRRERREHEVDPRHRAARQRAYRELLRHQTVQDVKNATCVIEAPTLVAVALTYDERQDAAPRIVALGERLVARDMTTLARRHGVPIHRDASLARALREVELGDEIPENLYDQVADALNSDDSKLRPG